MTEQPYQVVMPKLGLTMLEATLTEWHRRDGEFVEKGEPLFAFESDKATLELEAPVSGVLRILVPAGQVVPVNTPVALLGAGEVSAPPTPAAQPAASPDAGRGDRPPYAGVRASPKARALARQRGVSLDGLKGTGARGMITRADLPPAAAPSPAVKASPVARRMADAAGIDLAQVAGTGPRGQVTRRDVEQFLHPAPPALPDEPGLSEVIHPLGGLRALIADRLGQSWRERPQVTLTTDADATNLIAAREQAGAELGEKVSYNALLVWLAARALREHPYMNVRLTEQGIAQLAAIHIGVAVDSARGLLVPVVHHADRLGLAEINRVLAALVERALAGRSQPDDLTGGTFTLTNLGMYGIDAFTPIINPPECAILGVGRIVSRPVGLNGQIVLREMMALSLSFDHRLVDGAPAARFLARVRQLIERPFALALMP